MSSRRTPHHLRLLHRVAAERLAELLVEDHFDERRHPALLVVHDFRSLRQFPGDVNRRPEPAGLATPA